MSPSWSQPQARRVANLGIPDKIKCSSCAKNLSHDRFSRSQVQKYADSNKKSRGKDASKVQKPTCMACTTQPIFELTCKYCGITKALDGFSKNQRHTPDDARCIDCVQAHLDELDLEDAVEVEENFDVTDSDVTSAYRTDYLSESFAKLSANESVGSSAALADQCVEEDDVTDDGVWVNQSKPHPVPHMALNTMGGRIESLTPSVVSRNRNFAKVKADPVPPEQLLKARLHREEKVKTARRTVAQVEDSDTSSDAEAY